MAARVALRPCPRPLGLLRLPAPTRFDPAAATPPLSRHLHRSAPLRTAESSLTTSGDAYKHVLDGNKKWASQCCEQAPDFFPKCAKGQAPPILWLGCADSRVPETTVLGCKPGDIFTHRNIANIINPTDISLLSIVQFAVFHLKVKHIVVCGHTSCGGIAASLANAKLDVLDIWLQPIRLLREQYSEEIAAMDEKERGTFLAKKNIQAGIENLKRIPTVIDAMRERGVELHAVIYDLATGLLEEVPDEDDEKRANHRVSAFERK